MNFKGEKYEAPKYFINEVKAGCFSIKNVTSKEESGKFANQGSIIIQDSMHKAAEKAGRIGRDFFSNRNLFLDFHRSVFIICSNMKDLKRNHYQPDKFTQTPITLTSDGVVIDVDTDIGIKKFLLDTGSTISAIRNTHIQENSTIRNGMPVYESSKFIIRGTDFGGQILYLLDISPDFKDSDGILGMDFLSEHAVYLDFTKNIAYIGKTREVIDEP